MTPAPPPEPPTPPGPGDGSPTDDPVLARRRRIAGITTAGQRLGYLLYALAAKMALAYA